MPGHAERQRLDALQDVEGICRAHAGAEIAQALGARPHDEGLRSELLGKIDAVIARVRLGERRELASLLPVEAAPIDDDASNRQAMPAEPLRGGMQDEVGAMLDRP